MKLKRNVKILFFLIILSCFSVICARIFITNQENELKFKKFVDESSQQEHSEILEQEELHILFLKEQEEQEKQRQIEEQKRLEEQERLKAQRETEKVQLDNQSEQQVETKNNNFVTTQSADVVGTTVSNVGITQLVNKDNPIGYYIPNDLVLISPSSDSYNKYASQRIIEAWENMKSAAEQDGVYLSINSAYRSYKQQQETLNYFIYNYGSDYAYQYVSLPGTSEHQTGLAIDINSTDYSWLANNSYKYGFDLRYKSGKEHITHIGFEQWHFRYVGVELATYLHDNYLVLEEYR